MFSIRNVEEGKQSYDIQDEVFLGTPIIVGIEIHTSYIYVKGSSYLYDELCTLSGLDEDDLENYFIVTQ